MSEKTVKRESRRLKKNCHHDIKKRPQEIKSYTDSKKAVAILKMPPISQKRPRSDKIRIYLDKMIDHSSKSRLDL